MNTLNIYPYNKKGAKQHNKINTLESYLSHFWNRPALIISSARVSLYETLNFFGLNRSNHILVPDFICQSILNILNQNSFPVKIPDSRTTAVLVFHQWGYPQKMSLVLPEAIRRKLLIIEDCAHSLDSLYQGKPIGSFGVASIFSFAKILPTYLGGAITTNNQNLLDHLNQVRQAKNNFTDHLFNLVSWIIAKRSFNYGHGRYWLNSIYLESIHHPNIKKSALNLFPPNLAQLIDIQNRRRANYTRLRDQIKSQYLIPDHDKDINPNPICIPVFLEEAQQLIVQKKLRLKNIELEILHFDINRNIFQPDYRRCLAVPTHHNLPTTALEIIYKTINQS